MSNEKERYSPIFVAADTTVIIHGNAVGGFLCRTTGTITARNLAGVAFVDAHPVTAGVYYPLPFLIQNPLNGTGGTFSTAGGASGTLGV